jgi:hypothetical protein
LGTERTDRRGHIDKVRRVLVVREVGVAPLHAGTVVAVVLWVCEYEYTYDHGHDHDYQLGLWLCRVTVTSPYLSCKVSTHKSHNNHVARTLPPASGLKFSDGCNEAAREWFHVLGRVASAVSRNLDMIISI